jgi:SAM-dependent methyltransferase
MADAFTAFELQGWQASADPYYRYFEPLTSQAAEVLLSAIGQGRANMSLLDVATGPGYLARRAVERGFKPVVGVDFSPVMVELARRLSSSDAIEFREGDAQRLPEPDATYDAVAMNFGLLHLSEPQKAVEEARRVLKPRGRFGFTVWAEPDKAIGLAIVLSAIDRFADKNVPMPGGPPFFHFSTQANCAAALERAGFVTPQFQEIPLTWHLESGAALFEAFLQGTARTGGLLRLQSAETLAAIEEAVIRDTDPYKTQGQVQVPMCAVLAVGARP